MRQDSRPAMLAQLISFAKEQLILARVAGQAERRYHCLMMKARNSVLKLNYRRHWLWTKEEARTARKYVKRTLLEIEVINGQFFFEQSRSLAPLRSSLNGKNFRGWGKEQGAAIADIWGGFDK